MTIPIAIIVVLAFVVIQVEIYTDKQYKKRYAPILSKLVPGTRYPIWRLEEMLRDNQTEARKTK